jgi:hypothetical protein
MLKRTPMRSHFRRFFMSRAVSALVALILLLSLTLSASSQIGDPNNLPGPFHAYNINGKYGRTKTEADGRTVETPGHFHCLISDHDLDPGVLIFVRGLKGTLKRKDLAVAVSREKELKDLIRKLDDLSEQFPAARLETYVFFYDDNALPDVVKDDDARDKLEKDLQPWVDELKVKHTVFCLASRSLPRPKAKADEKLQEAVPLGKLYGLDGKDDKIEITVIPYKRLRIAGRRDFLKDELDDKKVDEIVDEARKKFVETR